MKIAAFDLETTNLQADFGIVLCGVVKEYKRPPKAFVHDPVRGPDDSAVIGGLLEELKQYSILVAHNGVRFDRPFLNSRAVKHGLEPLDPRGMIVDPVLLARRHLRQGSNSLASLSSFLQTKHRKTPVEGDVWMEAALGRDAGALAKIVEHCMKDVFVLEEVMEHLLPFLRRVNEWGSA